MPANAPAGEGDGSPRHAASPTTPFEGSNSSPGCVTPAAADEVAADQASEPEPEDLEPGVCIEQKYVVTGGGLTKPFPWVVQKIRRKGSTVYVGLSKSENGFCRFMVGHTTMKDVSFLTHLKRLRRQAMAKAAQEKEGGDNANEMFPDMKMKRRTPSRFHGEAVELDLPALAEHPACKFKVGR